MPIKFIDRKPPNAERFGGINLGVRGGQSKFHNLGSGENLKGRTQFVNALHRAVKQRVVRWVARCANALPIVGVKIGQAGHSQNFARVHIHQDGRGPLGVQRGHARQQNLFHRGLQGQVDRKRQRFG